MAARENQGLQIALIIFVVLTIALSATTFIFLRNYQEQQKRAQASQEDLTRSTAELTKLQGERDTAVQYIGFPREERDMTRITEAWTKDMEVARQYGIANLPDDQKNYRTLITSLQDVVRAKQAQLAKNEADLRDAVAAFDAKSKEYEDVKKALAAEKAQTVAGYDAERKRIADELANLTKSKNELMQQKEEKDKELERVKGELTTSIANLQKELDTLREQYKRKSEQYQEVTGEFVVSSAPDGKVSWVNAREGIAYINLGSDDRLRKKLTFSVFDPNTSDVSKGSKKGSIEVVSITGPHMAECKILQSSTANPILPGDLIYTPVWRVGQQDHVALVGIMDINGDGDEDRERIHDLISAQGGIIDAEVDAEGKLHGAITLNTRYVIVGEINAEKKEANDNHYKLLEDAKRFSVETIPLTKFVEMTGYAPKAAQGKLVPGEGVAIPNPGQPPSGFRPRNPPTRGNASGAF